MALSCEDRERILKFFNDEIDPREFAEYMRVFLHEVLMMQFEGMCKGMDLPLSPSTLNDGYFFLNLLIGYLCPEYSIYENK